MRQVAVRSCDCLHCISQPGDADEFFQIHFYLSCQYYISEKHICQQKNRKKNFFLEDRINSQITNSLHKTASKNIDTINLRLPVTWSCFTFFFCRISCLKILTNIYVLPLLAVCFNIRDKTSKYDTKLSKYEYNSVNTISISDSGRKKSTLVVIQELNG